VIQQPQLLDKASGKAMIAEVTQLYATDLDGRQYLQYKILALSFSFNLQNRTGKSFIKILPVVFSSYTAYAVLLKAHFLI
jgi:hypothetical protein